MSIEPTTGEDGEYIVFCNNCGAEMQPTIATCPRCGSVFGLIGTRSSGSTEVPPQIVAQTSGLYFGRLFAWSKIAGGAILSLMLVFHASWLTSFDRPQMQLVAVISLATGYGLLKQQMWGLYLLTAAFVVPIVHVLMMGEGHTPVRLLPLGIFWNLIGLWYFWEHRRELET